MVGTPVGGTLYGRFGFRAPFVFGEICTVVDLILRFLIIERDVALRWGYDPATLQHANDVASLESSAWPHHSSDVMGPSTSELDSVQRMPEQASTLVEPKLNQNIPDFHAPSANNLPTPDVSLVRKPLPLLSVMRLLGRSPRAMVALVMSLIYGCVL